MKVLKFGGTSVGSPERMRHVAELIIDTDSDQKFVVLSAMSGTTNSLIEISDYFYKGNSMGAYETIYRLESKYRNVIDELLSDPASKADAHNRIANIFIELRSYSTKDFDSDDEKEILSYGELMSTTLMSLYLQENGIEVLHIPALDFMRINEEDEPDMDLITEKLESLIQQKNEEGLQPTILLTEGFICMNPKGRIDNLRRGGSDYTASIIGAVLGAEEVQIWTDISGMHNNDPRYVENTYPVSELSFEEAAELAYFGAKILHPTCVLPAKLNNIPVRLLNTMEPEAPGTLIHNMARSEGIKAIAAKDNIVAIQIQSARRLLSHGFMSKVFETFDNHKTPIDMMATSEVSVTMAVDDNGRLDAIIEDLRRFGTVTVDDEMVIICIVGDLRWRNRGLESAVMYALSDIPVRMISYGGSNYNISVLVRACDKIDALRVLSKKLFNECFEPTNEMEEEEKEFEKKEMEEDE